jgi:hypothetical protein
MDMCENLLSRGYLTVCDNTFIWIQAIMIIFMLFITTLVVILFIKNSKLKQKQKTLNKIVEDYNMSQSDAVKRLLEIGTHGQDDVNSASLSTLEKSVAFETTKQQVIAPLVKEFALRKNQLQEVLQTVKEAGALKQAIDVTNQEIDFQQLNLIAETNRVPLACVLIDLAPAGLSYIEPEKEEALYTLITSDIDAMELIAKSDCKEFDKMSDLSAATIDKLIEFYADFDVTQENFDIVSQLAVMQLQSNIRKSKRGNYLDLITSMNAELNGNKSSGLSADVDKFKAAENAIGGNSNSQQELPESPKVQEVVENDVVDSDQENTLEKQSDNMVISTEPDSDEPLLSTDDDNFISKMFHDISQFRFKINEWRITLKQPIDFKLIGKERVQVLVEIAEQEKRSHPSNPDFTKVHDLLLGVLEKM